MFYKVLPEYFDIHEHSNLKLVYEWSILSPQFRTIPVIMSNF